jgi:hypothetical protein
VDNVQDAGVHVREWPFEPWTPERAARLRAAAVALAEAIRQHAEAVIAAVRDQNPLRVSAANDAVQAVVLEYAEAEYEFTGIGMPLDREGDDG